MAQNLESVPLESWFGQTDPFPYLVNQAARLDQFMQQLPGSTHTLTGVPVSPGCPPAALGHCWDTLDQSAACDWLDQQSLDRNPLQGRMLVDRDARWGNYDVTQAQPDRFSSFEFAVQPLANQITLNATDNVARLGFDLGRVELVPGQPITVITGTADGTGDRIDLRGLSAAPSQVTRNGVPVTQLCANSPFSPVWCYDAQTGVLELQELGSTAATWRITP